MDLKMTGSKLVTGTDGGGDGREGRLVVRLKGFGPTA